MQTLTLRGTDLEVSRACFGSMTFGAQTDEGAAARMVDLCFDHGVNFFDTANVYNMGASETMLGKTLKGKRSRVVLATKVHGRMGDGPDDAGLSRAALRKAIDASLRRLDTDYLDIYYLHQPDWATPMEETLAAMDELVRADVILGASKPEQVEQNLAAVENSRPLSPELVAVCDAVGAKLRGVTPQYNR